MVNVLRSGLSDAIILSGLQVCCCSCTRVSCERVSLKVGIKKISQKYNSGVVLQAATGGVRTAHTNLLVL